MIRADYIYKISFMHEHDYYIIVGFTAEGRYYTHRPASHAFILFALLYRYAPVSRLRFKFYIVASAAQPYNDAIIYRIFITPILYKRALPDTTIHSAVSHLFLPCHYYFHSCTPYCFDFAENTSAFLAICAELPMGRCAQAPCCAECFRAGGRYFERGAAAAST